MRIPVFSKEGDLLQLAYLVEPLARFEPRLVKMAPGNEPAED